MGKIFTLICWYFTNKRFRLNRAMMKNVNVKKFNGSLIPINPEFIKLFVIYRSLPIKDLKGKQNFSTKVYVWSKIRKLSFHIKALNRLQLQNKNFFFSLKRTFQYWQKYFRNINKTIIFCILRKTNIQLHKFLLFKVF